MIDNLLNYCSKFTQLTALDKEAMGLNFKPIELKRRDFLLKAGMVCDFVAFLNSGVIRHYHLKNGVEITCDITLKNNFITKFHPRHTYKLLFRDSQGCSIICD